MPYSRITVVSFRFPDVRQIILGVDAPLGMRDITRMRQAMTGIFHRARVLPFITFPDDMQALRDCGDELIAAKPCPSATIFTANFDPRVSDLWTEDARCGLIQNLSGFAPAP
jgi:hypothetical protein